MKRSKVAIIAMVLAGSFTFTSCIGPFKVTQSMWSWNKGLGSKFLNEVVFLSLHIIPVYELVYLADALVFNSIEFWTGKSANFSQNVQTENGNFLVEGTEDGYKLTNLDENISVNLLFEEESKTWSIEANGNSSKLMTLIDENNVKMYIGEETMNVELSEAGYMAFRQVVENQTYFAAK